MLDISSKRGRESEMLFQKRQIVTIETKLYQVKSPEAVSVARSAIGYMFAKLLERNGEWVDSLAVPTLLSFERPMSEVHAKSDWEREFDFEYWVWGNPTLRLNVNVTVQQNAYDRWMWRAIGVKMQSDPPGTDFGAAYWKQGPLNPKDGDVLRFNRVRFQNFLSSTRPNFW